MKSVITFLILVSGLAAQDKPKSDTPPIIDPALEAEYYRADGVMAHLELAMQQAKEDRDTVTQILRRVCGDKYDLQPKGKHLVCVPRVPMKGEGK